MHPWPFIRLSFSIDGAPVPNGWECGLGYWIEHGAHQVEIPKSSRGIRKVAFLGDDDELLFVTPIDGLRFSWESIQDGPTAVLEAAVIWRASPR
jgi:hypothetical protein